MELLCTKVARNGQVYSIPVNRVECILRTDREDRADCVRILGMDGIYDCLDVNDETNCLPTFEDSLIVYKAKGGMTY